MGSWKILVLLILLNQVVIADEIQINVTVPVSLKIGAYTYEAIANARKDIKSKVMSFFEQEINEDVHSSEIDSFISDLTDLFWIYPCRFEKESGEGEWLFYEPGREFVISEVKLVPVTPGFFDELKQMMVIYGTGISSLPEPFRSIFGDERTNIYLVLSDGTNTTVGVVSEDGSILEFKQDELEYPTLLVWSYENTIRKIANSEDQGMSALEAERNSELRYEGVGGFDSLMYGTISTLNDLTSTIIENRTTSLEEELQNYSLRTPVPGEYEDVAGNATKSEVIPEEVDLSTVEERFNSVLKQLEITESRGIHIPAATQILQSIDLLSIETTADVEAALGQLRLANSYISQAKYTRPSEPKTSGFHFLLGGVALTIALASLFMYFTYRR